MARQRILGDGISLSLPLLMFRVRTNYIDPALSPHDFAIATHPFDAGTHFHDNLQELTIVGK
jgi:hypothetical protein